MSVAIAPGTVVGGRFRIERLLGEGGMGAVFAAQNSVTGKRVAIKWMHPEIAANPDASARFMREAQICARLQHPNVVDVYDVLSEEASLFLVMELLSGETLGELMNRETTSLPVLISLLIDAMRGVAAAHAEGIVHRDIKPDNIFLAREGGYARPVAKVLDFGISKLTGPADVSITQTGAAMGTPLYMSVEQLSGARDVDARTDIYAFGVILYQAVTGQSPFEAESFAMLIAKIMTEDAIAPKTLRAEIPLSLSRLIERAMARNRDVRIASMEELIRELEPFATELGFRGQMTIGGSDIPSVRTPSSAKPAAGAAAATVPKTAELLRSGPPDPSPSKPSQSEGLRPASYVENTLNPVVTGAHDPSLEIAGRRSLGTGVIVGALVALAMLIGFWWMRSAPETTSLPAAHIVKPAAVKPIGARPTAAAQQMLVAPEGALMPPAVAPIPIAPSSVESQPQPATTTAHDSSAAQKPKGSTSRDKAAAPAPTLRIKPSDSAPAQAAIPAPAPLSAPAATDNSAPFRAGKPKRVDF